MAIKNKSLINVGSEYVKKVYAGSNLETEKAQPIYILYKDTIKSFLYEKQNQFGLTSKLLGFLGIEITIITTLFTATFKDFEYVEGKTIQGFFIALFMIFGFFILKDGFFWIKNKRKNDPENMTQELGKRGSIIKSPKKAGALNE